MADNEEEDTFFDSDFPDIADDEFRQLEQNAITFTQQAQASLSSRKTGSNQRPGPARTQRIDTPERYYRPTHNSKAIPRPAQQHRESIQNTSADSFDSTILDEDGLPLVVEEQPPTIPQRHIDETTAREQWRNNRFGQAKAPSVQRTAQISQRNGYHPQPTDAQANIRGAHPTAQLRKETSSGLGKHPPEEGEEVLRNRIAELEAERDAATRELTTRRGEIANIRAKELDAKRIHQRELVALQKAKQEEVNKHKATIEALVAEKQTIESDLKFKQQDLDEEARKRQSLQRQLKDRPLRDKPGNVNTTPKRNATSLRDGFDDEDLVMISPIKSGRRSKPGTPTANRKRKQPTASDLNVPPLVLRPSNSIPEVRPEVIVEGNKEPTIPPPTRKNKETERHLRLIQQVLTFRPSGSQEILVERLIRFSFPSDTTKTLSTHVLVETAKLNGKRLPGDLLQLFIDLWTRALQEKYHVCLEALLDIVNYILEIDLFVIDADIITKLLPVVQSTAEINARVRFRLFQKQDWLDNPENRPEFDPYINTTPYLDLLYTIASLVLDDTTLISLFWRSMGTDFVLMMTNACQPIPDLTIMLHLLSTSILPTTFGNICPPDQQLLMETYITDRVCYLLWEQPKTTSTEPPYPRPTICHLRLEALSLMSKLTITSSPNPHDPSKATNHGTTFLAQHHPTVIARLTRSIYDEVDNLYLLTPTQPLHATLINNALRILHFILNSPAARHPDFDLRLKLAGTNGGAHKYRVVLTRLAFSEGLYIDRGVTEDTVRLATELLEDCVTPDEAEDLGAAFGGSTGRSGGGRNTQG